MATEGVNLSEYNISKLPNTAEMKFGLVVAEWNFEITDALYRGAEKLLLATGTAPINITKIDVPGTFELVYGGKLLCETEDYDAVVVIGTVIQGETKHFDFVCEGVTQGVKDLNLNYKTPVIFCVLTDNNIQQSRDRSGGKHGNKGIECAVAAVKMAELRSKLQN